MKLVLIFSITLFSAIPEKIKTLLSLFILGACSGLNFEPPQKLNPAIYYKNDMCFKYDGEKFCGVGVIRHKEDKKLKIIVDNNIDKLVLTTCHREIDTDRPDKGLFRYDGVAKLHLNPTVEKGRACPYYFGAFEKKGRHSWGVVVVHSESYTLQGTLYCNGDVIKIEGSAICQSRENLIQRIIFKEPVKISKPVNGTAQRQEDCPVLKISNDGKVLEYKTPNRECLYGVVGVNSMKALQLYTIGYEQLIVR